VLNIFKEVKWNIDIALTYSFIGSFAFFKLLPFSLISTSITNLEEYHLSQIFLHTFRREIAIQHRVLVGGKETVEKYLES
jgi:hypothetical protein